MWLYDYTEKEQKTKKYTELYDADTFDRTPDGGYYGNNRWGDLVFYDEGENFLGVVETMENSFPLREEDCYEIAKQWYGNVGDDSVEMAANRAKRDNREMWKAAKRRIKKEYKTVENLMNEMQKLYGKGSC